MSLGALALSQLLGPGGSLGATSDSVRSLGPAKAKNVIFLHMVGAPSQLDLFDYKPELQKYDRQLAPKSLFEGKRFSFLQGHLKLLGTPFQFKQHGQSGAWISELMPHPAGVADDISFIRSVHTTEFNPAPAQLLFHTGRNRQGQPSLCSWVVCWGRNGAPPADYRRESGPQSAAPHRARRSGNSHENETV